MELPKGWKIEKREKKTFAVMPGERNKDGYSVTLAVECKTTGEAKQMLEDHAVVWRATR